MGEKLDITEIDTEALLRDFTVPDQAKPIPLDIWLKQQCIFPGTTRVGAKSLYIQYCDWCRANPDIIDKVPYIHVWGRDMGMRFKRGKGKQGNHYYISRERQVYID